MYVPHWGTHFLGTWRPATCTTLPEWARQGEAQFCHQHSISKMYRPALGQQVPLLHMNTTLQLEAKFNKLIVSVTKHKLGSHNMEESWFICLFLSPGVLNRRFSKCDPSTPRGTPGPVRASVRLLSSYSTLKGKKIVLEFVKYIVQNLCIWNDTAQCRFCCMERTVVCLFGLT